MIGQEPRRRTRGNALTRLLDKAVAEEAAREEAARLARPVQLDLFAELPSRAKPQPGRPRTARFIVRGGNRRGYRRE